MIQSGVDARGLPTVNGRTLEDLRARAREPYVIRTSQDGAHAEGILWDGRREGTWRYWSDAPGAAQFEVVFGRDRVAAVTGRTASGAPVEPPASGPWAQPLVGVSEVLVGRRLRLITLTFELFHGGASVPLVVGSLRAQGAETGELIQILVDTLGMSLDEAHQLAGR